MLRFSSDPQNQPARWPLLVRELLAHSGCTQQIRLPHGECWQLSCSLTGCLAAPGSELHFFGGTAFAKGIRAFPYSFFPTDPAARQRAFAATAVVPPGTGAHLLSPQRQTGIRLSAASGKGRIYLDFPAGKPLQLYPGTAHGAGFPSTGCVGAAAPTGQKAAGPHAGAGQRGGASAGRKKVGIL